MAGIKVISENRLRYISGLKGLNLIYLEKDYFLTVLLYLLKDVDKICFKGGTALNKIFLKHTRLSEDLDFACKCNISHVKDMVVGVLENNKDVFSGYNFENQTDSFFRIKVFYRSYFTGKDFVILDVNGKASVVLPPKKQRVEHFYEELPGFEILTLEPKELIAEKIRALITRNQPRDYFDVYMMLKTGYRIDLNLVKRKLEEAGQIFETERIFRNAQKIYTGWEDEIGKLTNRHINFITAIRLLEKEFRYKQVQRTGSRRH
jgi:predicted nucleotidyltransferase component of viral defense system